VVSTPGFHPGDWSSILHGAILFFLILRIWIEWI